jgi:hypothetical protein
VIDTNLSLRCRCRHEFCYLCLGKWHTCKCPTWDERNIVDARPPAAGQAAPAPAPVPAAVANPAPNVPANPVPAAFAVPAQARLYFLLGSIAPVPVLPQVQVQQPQRVPVVHNRNKNRRGRKRKNRPAPHEHDFERYYRSMDWDTTCDMCGHKDRWANCCSECDLKVCWYCTKHRV